MEQDKNGPQQPADEEQPSRLLARVLYPSAGIIGLICVYFLSYGPVLRYAPRPILMTFPASSGGTVTSKGLRYPGWVSVLYGPAFKALGPDTRPEYGKHDLLNTYKR